jgi:class 3 adenylate cyclase
MASRSTQMRIGMAAGEPIQEHDDVHGAVVVQASRIADLGTAGDVLVSDSVRQLAAGKGFDFQLQGEVRLKGFQEEERVWRASRRVATSSATPQAEG